jgi:hypothetical protein
MFLVDEHIIGAYMMVIVPSKMGTSRKAAPRPNSFITHPIGLSIKRLPPTFTE